MSFDPDDFLNEILENLDKMKPIRIEEIPNIDLYMDQVRSFMERHLGGTKRHSEDVVLTKAMINNYAKNDLLPPPVLKKYGRKHIIFLILIYYFKNVLSINDLRKLLGPLADSYFRKKDGLRLEDVCNRAFQLMSKQVGDLKEFIEETVREAGDAASRDMAGSETEEDAWLLQGFYLICTLAFDAYLKRRLIEDILDMTPDRKKKKKP
ncbi:MAG: DUF1836 domain-containing protein [Lachnospiraceae bacterium]|nr:DUF1836 domain-containing protein [Lachnospiraceae bacterium]